MTLITWISSLAQDLQQQCQSVLPCIAALPGPEIVNDAVNPPGASVSLGHTILPRIEQRVTKYGAHLAIIIERPAVQQCLTYLPIEVGWDSGRLPGASGRTALITGRLHRDRQLVDHRVAYRIRRLPDDEVRLAFPLIIRRPDQIVFIMSPGVDPDSTGLAVDHEQIVAHRRGRRPVRVGRRQ